MFKIGEFSQIARVSGRLLRYYDEIALLQPAQIDEETGYRYYSATQLSRLNRILVLKELGLSLEQIRRMLDEEISTDEMRGMLLMRQAQVEQTVRDELDRIRQIEVRLAQIAGKMPETDVVLKSVPAQKYLALDYCCPNFEHGIAFMQEVTHQICTKVKPENLGAFAVIFRSELYEVENFDIEMGFLLSKGPVNTFALQSGHDLSVRTLPAVETMATMVNVGLDYGNHLSYNTLGQWIEVNGYQLVGPGRELFLQMPNPSTEQEAVMEIQFPLETRESGKL